MVGHVGHEGGEEAGSDHEVPGSDVELQLQEADGSTRTCERAMEAKREKMKMVRYLTAIGKAK